MERVDRGPQPATRTIGSVQAETIAPARMHLRDGVPYSAEFGDIYHSSDGAGEVRRVFLDPSAFNYLSADEMLWVGELGFGTGLNFAVLAEHCLQQGQRSLRGVLLSPEYNFPEGSLNVRIISHFVETRHFNKKSGLVL